MKKTIAALVAAAALALVPAPAEAAPRHSSDGCVDKQEFQSAKTGLTVAQVEQRWEVERAGVGFDLGLLVILYPRCGYVQSYDSAWYGVIYRDRKVYTTMQWKAVNN